MTTALQVAGATSEPSAFAPLHINRLLTGLWTNSNPLRDAATSEWMEKFYGGRQDRLIGGVNCEITPKQTLRRRPGCTVYNNNTFPPIKRYYAWNTFTLANEFVRVLADTASTVYDVTGTADGTGDGLNDAIWQKSPGAGPTFFLGVGNTLFFTNGVDNKQWVAGANWQPNTVYSAGDRVLGSDDNVWAVAGFLPNPIDTIGVTADGVSNSALIVCVNDVAYAPPQKLIGTSVPSMNNVAFQPASYGNFRIVWNSLPSNVPTFPTTSTGGWYVSLNGTQQSSANQPAWSGTYIVENNILWQNLGPSVFDWGVDAPLSPPTVTQTFLPSPYGPWQANQGYVRTINTNPITLVDPNNNVQNLAQYGTLGAAAAVVWNPNPNQQTQDGTCYWENWGPCAWVASAAHNPTDLVVTASTDAGSTGIMYFYQAQNAANSAAVPPVWPSAVGALVGDGGQQWKNIGRVLSRAQLGDNTPIPGVNTILDNNGYIETVLQPGISGTDAPAWPTTPGGITDENAGTWAGKTIWINSGAWAVAGTAPVTYGYAYKNSLTEDITDMSPPSAQITVNEGQQVTVQGQGSGDPQVDTIVIYRTLQGGSTYGEIAEIPNPGAGQTWTYADTSTDADVNLELQAQMAGEGTPLPSGATCLEYHVGRIWAAVGNVIYGSSGPDAAVSGSSGNAGFNITFTVQSKVTRLWANSLGLAVFTVRDVYYILGDGTAGNPFTIIKYIEKLPLLNYDAFDVNLTTPYLLTGNGMLMALDPSAGVVEISFPIADIMATQFDPTKAYVSYHTGVSGEAAWYIADGAQLWYRLSPINAPDSGWNWNPPAYITGGTSAVQSVEILPGKKMLLIGPPAGGGPILQRDMSTTLDVTETYQMYAEFGSIVLAHPGQLAGLAWITLEAQAIGSAAALSVLMDEFLGTYEPVPRTRQDPPNLPPSTSLISNRHSLLQGQSPVWCRHLRMRLDWPEENAMNELLTYTLFGQVWQELRNQ